MQSEVKRKILLLTIKKCPFASFCRKIGIGNIMSKFQDFFYLCPYLRKIHSERSETNISIDNKNYDEIFDQKIREKKQTNTYRVFNRIGRLAGDFTSAEYFSNDQSIDKVKNNKKVSVWCSNDYLGMSRHPKVVEAAISTITKYGVGAGGTRNISGNSVLHEQLEYCLARWYQKEAGLVFTSCYVANSTTLCTLSRLLPGCVIFSDEGNHASMIEGIRNSRCPKHIYKHNNVEDLERLLSQFDKSLPKIVAFESVNSMNGGVAPIKQICDVSHKYGAITFLDEVHAVGLYGDNGSGLSEHQNCLDLVDIISGTLGKAVGTIGGYIVGQHNLVDVIRSYAPGLIFTTALPPSIMSSSIQSLKILQSEEGRQMRKKHQDIVTEVRRRIAKMGLPLLPSISHIIPILVGDSYLCKTIGKYLMDNNIYVQPINYPTVKFGTERLRIAPTPGHTSENMDHLLISLAQSWEFVGLKPKHPRCTNHGCKCTYSCSTYIDKIPELVMGFV